MSGSVLACPRCRSPWPGELIERGAAARCPACLRRVELVVFPAWRRPLAQGRWPERILTEGEAGCFFHPEKRAVVPCGLCGRFLCSLCDIELYGKHLCPGCLEAGRQKGRLPELETQRTVYDSAALYLATLPLLLCYPITLVTAPTALFLAVRFWKAPSSLLPRSKARLVVALALASLQIAGWATLSFILFRSRT